MNRDRNELILDIATEGFWDWDLKTDRAFLSPRYCELVGYSPDDTVFDSRFFETIIHPDDRNHVFKIIGEHLQGKSDISVIEYRMIAKDGSVRWIEGRGKIAEYDEQGAPSRMVGTIIDISERKLANIAKSRSLLRQRAILDNLPMMAWLKDSESRLEMVNEPYAKACGYSVEDCIGKTDLELFPGEMARGFIADDREVCNSGQKKQKEEQISTPNGTIWHLTYKTPLFDEQGRVVGTTGIAQDITGRKQAEEALRESEARFRRLLHDVQSVAVQGYGPDGTTQYWNQASERLYGYSAQEAIGCNLLELIIPPEMRDGVREAMRQMAETGQPIPASELLLQRKDGLRVPVYSTHTIVQIPGRMQELFCVDIDLSESKRAEEEKNKLEAQLQQAQKMESVGRLAGGVAHDFNNMLLVILGHAELALLHLDPDQPLYAHLEQIRKSAERSANLTRQLLAFARKQTVAPKVLDLNETMAGMLKMLQRLIGEDIRLIWKPAANLWEVNVDPSQIDQILANLCVNARDAIADVGEITIETGNSVFDTNDCADCTDLLRGEYVRLVVSDNGCGMDKETLAHIFEPFFTTKNIGKGTGLGLATVYGIVKQNDGLINAVSEPGLGTTFTIYLPRYRGEAEQTHKKGELETVRSGEETILLVEDEPAILGLTARLLTMQGYRVLAAATPGEAIRLASEQSGEINLLLTDVVMPEMNGRDLAKTLLSLYPSLKSLFMSGYTADVIAHHGLLGEGVHFIQKPFSLQELAAKVREVLDSHFL